MRTDVTWDAGVIALAALGRQIVGSAQLVAAFLHEVIDGLGGEAEQCLGAGGACLLVEIRHQFEADALILVLA